MGPVPDQAPPSPRTVTPTRAFDPPPPSTRIVTLPVRLGFSGWTTSVSGDSATTASVAFVAVTRARRVWPTSASVSVNLAATAPGTGTQPVPWASQRSHAYV